MKSILKAFSVVALSGAMLMPVLGQDTNAPAATPPADAKDQKDLKKVIEDQGINYVETAQKGITLSGYVDTSYTEQFGGSGQTFQAAGTTGTTNAQRQFDHDSNGFNINAVKIALEMALPDKNDWAAGFRIDTIYGQDANYLQDTALESTGSVTGGGTGLALEQALVKFRIPVGNGLDIYAGKFVTFLGYEVIESPANPNFSRGLLFTDAIPLTHTGVYADYKFNDTVEAKLGVVDGWNNSTSVVNAGGQYAFGDKAITGQLTLNAPGKNASLIQSFIYSPNGDAGVTGAGTTGNHGLEVYDLVGTWTPTFDKAGNTTLGFNVDLGEYGQGYYGFALYAGYKFNSVFSLNARGEYLHGDASATPKWGAAGVSEDDWSETLTATFNIWANLLTRAEYRLDDLSAGSSGTGHSQVANELSLEAIYSF
jgi:hypothetical protein